MLISSPRLSARLSYTAIATVCAAVLIAGSAGPAGAGPGHHPANLGRQTLAPEDGWASSTAGTTGGSAAARDRVHVVRNRAELVAALGGETDATPKIIYVSGTIDANVDAQNNPLTCEDYATDGYRLEAYLEAYDPATWGENPPTGPLEEARQASAERQADRIQIPVGANTTIVGLGKNARIKGANLLLDEVDNVIIRNIDFVNTHDCFPAWDPTDGDAGEWNAEYDAISLRETTHVWVDHNTFSDRGMPDSEQPVFFGRPFQVHDGLLDITNASDLVTASWNRFTGHDKVMLIGSSNNAPADVGRLRVTVHHNRFQAMGQRTPRVRFGQVDVYNNHYVESSAAAYSYSWGVGVQSAIVAEHNALTLPADIGPERIIFDWGGTAIRAADNIVNGAPVDLLGAYNAAFDPDLSGDPGWTPTLRTTVHRPRDVPRVVAAGAGAGRLTS